MTETDLSARPRTSCQRMLNERPEFASHTSMRKAVLLERITPVEIQKGQPPEEKQAANIARRRGASSGYDPGEDPKNTPSALMDGEILETYSVTSISISSVTSNSESYRACQSTSDFIKCRLSRGGLYQSALM